MTALLSDEPYPAPEEYLTPEEYLALEEVSPIRHEYANGYVRAMAGSSWAHNVIAANILIALGTQLEGKLCIPFINDRRLRISLTEERFYYYPDITVDCSGSTELEAAEPTVVFEVLSASTSGNDRGEKLIHYLNLPSMRVYGLVDQRRAHVTIHRRAADGTWGREILTDLDAAVALPEIACTLPLRTIYRRLPFAAEG
jgi:Uma2 family endonuclease